MNYRKSIDQNRASGKFVKSISYNEIYRFYEVRYTDGSKSRYSLANYLMMHSKVLLDEKGGLLWG